jgi:hypothetical protein
MGPTAAKSYPGAQLVRAAPQAVPAAPAERARQEIDYGRRGKGYIYGAFRPATGEAFTAPYERRATIHWVDFLEQVEAWLPAEAETVYAIVDNLSMHRATDVLLFSLAHPRWEFVFQPKYAAYLCQGQHENAQKADVKVLTARPQDPRPRQRRPVLPPLSGFSSGPSGDRRA